MTWNKSLPTLGNLVNMSWSTNSESFSALSKTSHHVTTHSRPFIFVNPIRLSVSSQFPSLSLSDSLSRYCVGAEFVFLKSHHQNLMQNTMMRFMCPLQASLSSSQSSSSLIYLPFWTALYNLHNQNYWITLEILNQLILYLKVLFVRLKHKLFSTNCEKKTQKRGNSNSKNRSMENGKI